MATNFDEEYPSLFDCVDYNRAPILYSPESPFDPTDFSEFDNATKKVKIDIQTPFANSAGQTPKQFYEFEISRERSLPETGFDPKSKTEKNLTKGKGQSKHKNLTHNLIYYITNLLKNLYDNYSIDSFKNSDRSSEIPILEVKLLEVNDEDIYNELPYLDKFKDILESTKFWFLEDPQSVMSEMKFSGNTFELPSGYSKHRSLSYIKGVSQEQHRKAENYKNEITFWIFTIATAIKFIPQNLFLMFACAEEKNASFLYFLAQSHMLPANIEKFLSLKERMKMIEDLKDILRVLVNKAQDLANKKARVNKSQNLPIRIREILKSIGLPEDYA